MINWWLEDFWPVLVVLAILAFLVAMIFVSNKKEMEEDRRLMAQCIADGRKEYECVSMLSRKETTIIVPAPVVVR